MLFDFGLLVKRDCFKRCLVPNVPYVLPSFALSLVQTIGGTTKNISSKRLNEEAMNVIKKFTMLVPGKALQYVKDEF